MARILLLAILPLLAISCRGVPPWSSDPLERKRHQLEMLKDMERNSAGAEDQVLAFGHEKALRADLLAEENREGALPPRPAGPPFDAKPPEELAKQMFLYGFQVDAWFEDVWLDHASPSFRPEVEKLLSDNRQATEMAIASWQKFKGAPYALTQEHTSFIQGVLTKRTAALATEKDSTRHAFLDASVVWWNARLSK